MFTMAQAARVLTDWVGDPGAVEEYGVRFSRPVVVPDDDRGRRWSQREGREKLDGNRVRVDLTDLRRRDGADPRPRRGPAGLSRARRAGRSRRPPALLLRRLTALPRAPRRPPPASAPPPAAGAPPPARPRTRSPTRTGPRSGSPSTSPMTSPPCAAPRTYVHPRPAGPGAGLPAAAKPRRRSGRATGSRSPRPGRDAAGGRFQAAGAAAGTQGGAVRRCAGRRPASG